MLPGLTSGGRVRDGALVSIHVEATRRPESDRDAAIDAGLQEATRRFAEVNPASRARSERASEVMPGGNTRSVLHHAPFPLAFESGRDATLTSLDGREYTDLLGEFTAGLFGHSNPGIMAALHATLDAGISFGGHNAHEAELARLVVARFPSLELVRFTNSGTEANLMALATAIDATGRDGVLVFNGGYHGGVLSFVHGRNSVNVPHRFVLGEYGDIDGTRALIRAEAGRLAAVLVEPMLGSGGCVPASREFLAMLREEASSAGAVLVFDEVMTSRLSPGGLQARLGITPDLTTLGKYLGGGMSFGAFGGRTELMGRFDPSRSAALAHAGTFNNNVLTMAAGVAALGVALRDEALDALNTRGDRLREALNALFRDRGVAMCATGIGSLLTIHPVAAVAGVGDAQAADPRLRQLLFLDLVEAGFWIAARGMLALSLPVTDDDCERFVREVAGFVDRRAALLG